MSDLYALLGVTPESSEEEIRAAYYRRLSFDQPASEFESERARELREAYEILSDPDRRRSYDASRGIRQVAPLTQYEVDYGHNDHHTLNPVSRATRNLPRGWRITID